MQLNWRLVDCFIVKMFYCGLILLSVLLDRFNIITLICYDFRNDDRNQLQPRDTVKSCLMKRQDFTVSDKRVKRFAIVM